MMNLDKLNPVVKAAMEALQNGDKNAWEELFTFDAEMFDDGIERDLRGFTRDAVGKERFTSIDKIENEGCDVYGDFHSPQWGDFQTYFKFTLNQDGKIKRLDIGQT
jgi:hypothetical protein